MPAVQKTKYKRLIWSTGLVAIVILMVVGRIPNTELTNMPYPKGLSIRGGIRVSPELLACIIAISI